jgi:two-component system response regulator YesN
MKLNAAYLSRLFKEQTGETFSSFVARTRMEKARDLLVTTDISVEEIGRMVGVSSRSTFNRLFKKFVGVSPGTYRVIRK